MAHKKGGMKKGLVRTPSNVGSLGRKGGGGKMSMRPKSTRKPSKRNPY